LIQTNLETYSGGAEFLLEVAGEDATEAYDNAGHSDEAHEILPELEIGTLKLDPASKSDPVQQVPNHVIEHAKETGTTILKPDVFQEFELEEKTLVSHNVAM
jgi:cytochrome-b5 reductase